MTQFTRPSYKPRSDVNKGAGVSGEKPKEKPKGKGAGKKSGKKREAAEMKCPGRNVGLKYLMMTMMMMMRTWVSH